MSKIAFLCSGQGAQCVGMGIDFAERFEAAAELLELAGRAAHADIRALIEHGPLEELSRTQHTQPALVAVSLAIAHELEERGVHPDCVAGFSLGEYAAHVIAKTLDARTALELVSRRGAVMAMAADQREGGMAALLRCDLAQAARLCRSCAEEFGQVLAPSNVNCPGQVVISGEKEALEAACERWKEQGGKFAPVKTSGAFHCQLMEPAARQMGRPLASVAFSEARIPLYCNYNALPLVHGSEAESLVRQITSPVLWEDTIRNMIADGVDTFVECGPGKVLTGMAKRTARDMGAHVELVSVATVEELEACNV